LFDRVPVQKASAHPDDKTVIFGSRPSASSFGEPYVQPFLQRSGLKTNDLPAPSSIVWWPRGKTLSLFLAHRLSCRLRLS
jgi:hypothetical protein